MEDIRNNNLLSDDDIEQVIGGANKRMSFEERRDMFDVAWELFKMEDKGFTGNRKAELFEEWEMADDNDSPSGFLTKFLKKA